ncbi:MAG: DUF1501 domain-containing protein [Pseudomonadota bacterium]
MDRRQFLKYVGGATMVGAHAGLGPTALSAWGADSSGYKALVCVFLFGGLDNHDFLLPYDASAYDEFARLRQTLLRVQGSSRAREALLPLIPANAASGDARWALPPEMPMLRSLFERGSAALVANVGPLIEPVTAQSFFDDSARLPPRLFSHNDQQAIWQSSAPEGALYGWGGLFADAFTAEGASTNGGAFSTISTVGSGPFLTGRRAFPYQVSDGGAAEVYLLGELDDFDARLPEGLKTHLSGSAFNSDYLIRRDMGNALSKAFSTNDAYNAARGDGFTFSSEFPASELGSQLRTVAETIAIRDALGVQRQVFFVGMGGFDTHSAQAQALPLLLGQLDGAVGAFNVAMNELGVDQQVTLFTASDFGRTLAVNGDGTDHGWGGHQFVVGGAVAGTQLLGSVPPPGYGHDLDSGGGRLIPTISVEQYAEALGRWFGLTDGELLNALPALQNFNRSELGLFSS